MDGETIVVEETLSDLCRTWKQRKDEFIDASKKLSLRLPENSTELQEGDVAFLRYVQSEQWLRSLPRQAIGIHPKGVGRPMMFDNLERFREIIPCYTKNTLRPTLYSILRTKHRDEIWDLIIKSFDNGFISAANPVAATNPDMRIIFAGTPARCAKKFDLRKAKHVEIIRDSVMPMLLENKIELLKRPQAIETFLSSQHILSSSTTISPGEQEVFMYGVRLWPQPRFDYNYYQLTTAVWFFTDLNHSLESNPNYETPAARAQRMRLLLRWPKIYASKQLDGPSRGKQEAIFNLVQELSRFMEDSPEGLCNFPSPPSVDP
jgi:hypothetical protein